MTSAHATPHDALCITCRYPLRDLLSTRCPECGRAFDPSDLSSMRVPGAIGPVGRWWLKPAGKFLAAWAWIAAVVMVTTHHFLFDAGYGGYAVLKLPRWTGIYDSDLKDLADWLWIALFGVWVARVAARRYLVFRHCQTNEILRLDRPARRRTALLFLASLLLSSTVQLDRCPHAEYVLLWNSIGIAYHCPNGPCANHASRSCRLPGGTYLYITERMGERLRDLGL